MFEIQLFLEPCVASFEDGELKSSATQRKSSICHFAFPVCFFVPSLTSRTVICVAASSLKPSKRH